MMPPEMDQVTLSNSYSPEIRPAGSAGQIVVEHGRVVAS
jgi:hypothetical protein